MNSLQFRQRLIQFDNECSECSDMERAVRYAEMVQYLLVREACGKRDCLVGDDSFSVKGS